MYKKPEKPHDELSVKIARARWWVVLWFCAAFAGSGLTLIVLDQSMGQDTDHNAGIPVSPHGYTPSTVEELRETLPQFNSEWHQRVPHNHQVSIDAFSFLPADDYSSSPSLALLSGGGVVYLHPDGTASNHQFTNQYQWQPMELASFRADNNEQRLLAIAENPQRLVCMTMQGDVLWERNISVCDTPTLTVRKSDSGPLLFVASTCQGATPLMCFNAQGDLIPELTFEGNEGHLPANTVVSFIWSPMPENAEEDLIIIDDTKNQYEIIRKPFSAKASGKVIGVEHNSLSNNTPLSLLTASDEEVKLSEVSHTPFSYSGDQSQYYYTNIQKKSADPTKAQYAFGFGGSGINTEKTAIEQYNNTSLEYFDEDGRHRAVVSVNWLSLPWIETAQIRETGLEPFLVSIRGKLASYENQTFCMEFVDWPRDNTPVSLGDPKRMRFFFLDDAILWAVYTENPNTITLYVLEKQKGQSNAMAEAAS